MGENNGLYLALKYSTKTFAERDTHVSFQYSDRKLLDNLAQRLRIFRPWSTYIFFTISDVYIV